MPTYNHYLKLSKEGGKHAQLFAGMAEWAKTQLCSSPLSDAENQVARLLSEGYNRTDISMMMDVSAAMISKRVSAIRKKVGAKGNATDANLVYVLIEHGWLP